MEENKISTIAQLSDYLESETWLHRCQLDIKMIDWLDESNDDNIIKFIFDQEESKVFTRCIKLGDSRYELYYTTFGCNIKEDIYDTAIHSKKLDEIGSCQLAIFSQFGDLEDEEEEDEEEINLVTKKDLSDHLEDNPGENFWTSQLDYRLIKWLDEDHEDNIFISKNYEGKGGIVVWSRKLLLESGIYLINYATYGKNIEKSKCNVTFEVQKK